MADNYLEKRMEELRSGRLGVKGGIPGIRPGALRVVVAGGSHGAAKEQVLEFRKKGYRVAVFDNDEKEGKRMAYENGIRFHHIDLTDDKAIQKETASLLKAWRGVDIIIGDKEQCQSLSIAVKNWKDSLPIPDNSETKIVII